MNEQIPDLLRKGMAKHTSGCYQEAEILYRRVLQMDPNQPDAIHFIGVIAFQIGNYQAAREYLARAIELAPGNPGCYNNMGNLMQKEGDLKGSVPYYEKTLQLDATNHMAHNNLGAACIRLGEYERARSHLEEALKLSPEYAGAQNNMGEVCSYLGLHDTAAQYYKRAIELEPNLVDAHWNLSLSLLLSGDFKNGFKEYEWRWKRRNTPKRIINPERLWQGEILDGKSILVYEEQGLGDAIQFIRYLPMIKQRGGNVIFETSPAMARLFVSVESIDKLWVRNTRRSTQKIDRFDVHCPVLSLPRLFDTKLDSIPSPLPYLAADKAMAASWKKQILSTDKLKVGIVWAGNPDHRNDHNRSCFLSAFKPLAGLPEVEFVSLQKDKYEKWTDMAVQDIATIDVGDDLHDFADTAAVIENLDLIISVDTAVVHLAGALGKETWVLLPFYPDWRWMLDRTDSPWYPSMTLFRQKSPGDWPLVFRTIKDKLVKKSKGYTRA